MAFDLDALRTACKTEPVIRVLVVDYKGSVPCRTGVSMLVSQSTIVGTIGGGALEYNCIEHARSLLTSGKNTDIQTISLGPELGQCCGGQLKLVYEFYDETSLPKADQYYLRSITNTNMPKVMQRLQTQADAGKVSLTTSFEDGWIYEPLAPPSQHLWLYGAGHVGREIVEILHNSGVSITWVDTAQERFPAEISDDVDILVSQSPSDVVKYAPDDAVHYVMTYSHAFDLNICSAVLARPHKNLGLIGSQTKLARFKKRLTEQGHSTEALATLICPIGDPRLGRTPRQIAIGASAQIIGLLNQVGD